MNRSTTPSTTVLITGVTGFIGKVLLAELLGPRWRDRFGHPRVLLLIRGADQADAEARFAKIAAAPCFRDLPPGWQHACEVLRGDITEPDCGLDARALARVTGGVHRHGHQQPQRRPRGPQAAARDAAAVRAGAQARDVAVPGAAARARDRAGPRGVASGVPAGASLAPGSPKFR